MIVSKSRHISTMTPKWAPAATKGSAGILAETRANQYNEKDSAAYIPPFLTRNIIVFIIIFANPSLAKDSLNWLQLRPTDTVSV